MAATIEERLEKLGIALPEAATPAANYLATTVSGNQLFVSGQLPLKDGALIHAGLLGRDLDVDEGNEAAKWCAVNILAQAAGALGTLDKIKRVVKITVFVASTPDFVEQHLVANGASDFLAEILGGAGRHARAAVGTTALPLNAPVEVEAIIEF